MAKGKDTSEFVNPPEKDVVHVMPKEGPFDGTQGVKLITTKHPYLKAGTEIYVAEAVAAKCRANGWAK